MGEGVGQTKSKISIRKKERRNPEFVCKSTTNKKTSQTLQIDGAACEHCRRVRLGARLTYPNEKKRMTRRVMREERDE